MMCHFKLTWELEKFWATKEKLPIGGTQYSIFNLELSSPI